MSFRPFVRAAWVVAALFPASAFGQAGNSTIAGVVKDATGGALPGVSATIVNEDTAVAVSTVTNGEGLYRVPALVPGRYRIETTLDEFDRTIRGPVRLEVSQTLAIDITLGVAGQTEKVSVSAEAPPLVDALGSTIAQMVTREMLDALPLPNRANFYIPGFTLGAPDVGAISSARQPRTLQIGSRFSF
jgi:hypothetical protein